MRTALLLAALLLAGPALGAQAVEISVEGLARASDAVVRGQVRRLSTTRSPDRRRLFTLAEVAVTTSWRGAAAGTVTVLLPGGVDGDLGQRVDGAPTLAEGEEVVLFLHRAEAGTLRVAGLAQGKFTVAGGLARPDLSRLHFLGSRVERGERQAGTMPLDELEARVRSVP